MKLPKARTAEILEQEAGSELLIYDLQIDKAYTLNETSKIVFNACAKRMSFDELKRASKFTDDLIYLALDELKSSNLLENYESRHFSGLSRREVIRKVGLASMIALPVISSIIAPHAANAASGGSCPAGSTTDQGGTIMLGRGGPCQCSTSPKLLNSCNTTRGGENGANSCRSGCVCDLNQPATCFGNSCIGTCNNI